MKLLTLLSVVVIFSTVEVDSRRANPSFLKYIGSINALNDSKRNFYLSQQIEYSWTAANSFCKLNGMRLAVFPDDKKMLEIFVSHIFDDRETVRLVYVDSQSSVNGETGCRLFTKLGESHELIKTHCFALPENKRGFICEDIEESNNCTEPDTHTLSDSTVSEKFFDFIGELKDENGGVIKKYFMSNEVQGSPADAIKYCQSMNMILASPQSQREFDELREMLQSFPVKYSNAAIAGYSSSNGIWLDSGDQLNYKINWGHGEPNNAKRDEACIFMQRSENVSVNDDPCNSYSFPYGSFICELKLNAVGVNEVNKNDQETHQRFISLFTVIGGLKRNNLVYEKRLYVSQDDLKVKWIDAVLFCKSLGMEIFVPDTFSQVQFISMSLPNLTTAKSFHTGLTKVGQLKKWYSINDGEESKIKELFESVQKNFIGIRKSGASYNFGISDHETSIESVICQKLVLTKVTEEQTPHASQNEV